MAKSFLILMLMTTQLLAASGGSVYVCIRNDGTLCCLDRGPSDCACCEEEEIASTAEQKPETPAHPSGCRCGCSSPLSCEPDDSAQPGRFAELGLLSDDPCGCSHFLISHDQASARPAPTASTFDADILIQSLFETPVRFGSNVTSDVSHATFQQFNPPPIPSQAIVVLSWVLIQC